MPRNAIVSRDEWIEARKAHLADEKEFTRLRDKLSAQRRALPWYKVDKNYTFEGPEGGVKLSQLFDGRSQLIIYHFMFHPDWDEGCKSCSFWADGYNPLVAHLNARDTSLAVVSRGPLAKLQAYKKRMGWDFTWVSSHGTDFNKDFGVTFTPDEVANKQTYYNYSTGVFGIEEAPGLSIFFQSETGDIFHTYSCYARGLDMLNAAYHYLDLVPKGRDEQDLPYGMAWVRRHDEYGEDKTEPWEDAVTRS